MKPSRLIREIGLRSRPSVPAALFRDARKLPVARIKNILVTTDFSEASMQGVRFAASFAEKLGANLALVHIVEPTPWLSAMNNVVFQQIDTQLVKRAEKQAAKLAKRLSRKDLTVTSFVRSGKPFKEIAALARKREAQLVVTATRGQTGLKRFLMGSTAELVVRHASCPVITVPAQTRPLRKNTVAMRQLRKVVVAIDFSKTSAQALPYAATLAERFGAEVILLHVIRPAAATAPYSPSDLQDALQAMNSRATAELSRLCKEGFDENVGARIAVRVGMPYYEITKAAKGLGTDMIILTTHGYTGLKRGVLGSTAERVVRYASCPVFVVRQIAGRAKQPLLKRAIRTTGAKKR